MPKEDLYGTLGVDPAASEEEVRKAYRKRAKKVHPDAGGSEEEFHAVSRALRILTNPKTRAQYDRGEEPDEESPDNPHARMLGRLSELIREIFEEAVKADIEPHTIRIADAMRDMLNKNIAGMKKAKANGEKELARWKKLAGRFKGPMDRVTALEALTARPVKLCIEGIKKLHEQIEREQAALAYLDGVDFEADMAPPDVAWGDHGVTVRSAMTSEKIMEIMRQMQEEAFRGSGPNIKIKRSDYGGFTP